MSNCDYRQILEKADRLYREDPDWVTFYRKILGLAGIVPTVFHSYQARALFADSEEYARIERMLVKLWEKTPRWKFEFRDPERVITVRLPDCLHAVLKSQALERRVSMNSVCIAKLLRPVPEAFFRPQTNPTSNHAKGDKHVENETAHEARHEEKEARAEGGGEI